MTEHYGMIFLALSQHRDNSLVHVYRFAKRFLGCEGFEVVDDDRQMSQFRQIMKIHIVGISRTVRINMMPDSDKQRQRIDSGNCPQSVISASRVIPDVDKLFF